MLIKRLTKLGNSHALILDAPILSLLKWEVNDGIEITTDGQSLTLRKSRLYKHPCLACNKPFIANGHSTCDVCVDWTKE